MRGRTVTEIERATMRRYRREGASTREIAGRVGRSEHAVFPHIKDIPLPDRYCKLCGNLFEPARTDHLFCSLGCGDKYRYAIGGTSFPQRNRWKTAA